MSSNGIRLVDQVIGFYGNCHRMSKALKVSPQTVYRWRDQGYIPVRYAVAVHWETGGAINKVALEKDTHDRQLAARVAEELRNG